jgi:hypothetical protein
VLSAWQCQGGMTLWVSVGAVLPVPLRRVVSRLVAALVSDTHERDRLRDTSSPSRSSSTAVPRLILVDAARFPSYTRRAWEPTSGCSAFRPSIGLDGTPSVPDGVLTQSVGTRTFSLIERIIP